jgi:DNA-binding winged helix-turn-helix (wHTH) protein/tetratricopeptide (TPR) repeat protein
MRMVFFVAKLGSLCSSASHFRDTFPARFGLFRGPCLNANASCSESGLNVLKNGLISFELPLGVVMDRQAKHLLEFGPFRMDLVERVLMRDREPIILSPKAFETLLVLAQHSERVVLKDDLMKILWPDTFVEESNLSQHIFQLRKALGDRAHDPEYIVTVPGRGYRFALKVSEITEPDGDLIVRSHSVQTVTVEEESGKHGSVASSDRSFRQKPWILGATAAVLIVIAGSGIYWQRSNQTAALTERDTMVLGEFVNTTGDTVFDDTLKQGLAVQLEQSPFVALVSDRKVNETLKLMGRPVDDRLTPEITREVCLRTGSKAMLTGSIVRLGSQFVIGLKATNCNTGDALAVAQQQAVGKEAVLKALDAAAVHLRRKLGESLISIQKFATPVEQATTPSLEALKAYSLGRKTGFAKGASAALPFYKRAVELDPNFAMAYRGISVVYTNRSEVGRATENARRAYELRAKVSEQERFSIEATYYMHATGELENAVEVYELWQQTYPKDFFPYANLGVVYGCLGNWEKALEETREGLRLEPSNQVSYGNLAKDYTTLNRLDEAQAVYKQAEERKLESEFLSLYGYQLFFGKDDTAQMAQVLSAAVGKPGPEDLLLAGQADTQAWHGNFKNARELTRQAMDSAQRNNAKEAAALYQTAEALREVELGNREQARADADAAVKMAPNRDVQVVAALVLARAGDPAAENVATELNKAFPLDTLVQRYWLPTIRAALALQRRDPSHAIELLKVAKPIELSQPTNLTVSLCPVYLRGEAYLRLHNGIAAAAEFQKFIDHRGLVVNFSWGALARLGLARAYAQTGDTEKSLAHYGEFLALWKNADPGLIILKEANAEYKKLGAHLLP